jgi:acetyltransferase
MESQTEKIQRLFNPRSIAVIGASTDPIKIGHLVLRSALLSRVEKVYPVHAGGAKEIGGCPAYPTIEAIPDRNVDLFLFVIRQQDILEALRAAIGKGCRGAVIFTAGYRETGREGETRQEALYRLSEAAGIPIIGPNTLGFFRGPDGVNATFLPYLSEEFPSSGKITVISQSGGVGALIAGQFIEDRLAMGTLVSVGNRMNVDFSDMLNFCADDRATDVVAVYLEGLEDGRAFYQAAGRCAGKKPVVIFHAGQSRAGQRSSISHTGSMAASSAIYRGMFRQAGLIEVSSLQELSDTVKCLSLAKPPGGNRVALVTHTAGPAIVAADILEQGGMDVVPLQEETRAALAMKKTFPPFISPDNPVDLATSGMERRAYLDVVEVLTKDPNIDAVLTVCVSLLAGQEGHPLYFPIEAFKREFEGSDKTLVMLWGAPVTREEEFKPWENSGIPVYPTPERAAKALLNLYRYGVMGRRVHEEDVPATRLPQELIRGVADFQAGGAVFVGEVETKQLLALAGISVAETFLAENEKTAVDRAEKLGYPVAMKIVSDRIIHKSDAGCVRLGLREARDVGTAWREILLNASAFAAPDEIRGIAIQPMLPPGFEVIVGGLYDRQAGPVVMFGLGGIWVEALNEVVFRLAPVSRKEAADMVSEVRGSPLLLEGGRGYPPVNRESLLNLIVTVGQMMATLPLAELDLNPVVFYEGRYAVADARMVLRPRP